jgi:DnaJ domain
VQLRFDPYTVLGVPRDATGAQIAQARRRLSRQYHPDVNSAPDAAARFDEVQQAFTVLSDPAARAAYDRSGARPPAAREAREDGSATEVAPGIFVQPAAVDFGRLVPSRPWSDARVTVAWTGAPPARIVGEPGSGWWTTLRAERPNSGCVVFYLRAQAHAGVPTGRRHHQFTVTLDDTRVTVELTAEIEGVFPRASAPAADARRRTRRAPGRLLLSAVLLCVPIGGAVIRSCSSGSSGAGVSAPAPPSSASVPKTSEPATATRPVFTASPAAAEKATELRAGLAGPPGQRGSEILLPVAAPPDPGAGRSGPCVTVRGAEPGAAANQAGAAGNPVTEYALGPVSGHGQADLAFPAVLPGRYTFYRSCAPNGAVPVTLGTVTVKNLGVLAGARAAVPGNAMVVFAVSTSGATTTVSYSAIGPGSSVEPSLTSPAADSCVYTGETGQSAYRKPEQSLISQRVTGTAEWLETGTLVFHGLSASSRRGDFYYNCAHDIPVGETGISIP